jgi:hypothetical protein
MKDPNDKSHMPWSVKGVSKAAREAAKAAAAEQGVTMGEWLSKAIKSSDRTPDPENNTADASLGSAPAQIEGVQDLPTPERLRSDIAASIVASETRILAMVEPLQDIIHQLSSRIEALEQRPPPHASDVKSIASSNQHSNYCKTGWD